MSAAQEELLGDILNDNVLKPEPKKEEKKPEAKKEAAAHAQQGSILRVDSRRIDNLLNLVSEAVINKASFNQLAMQNAAELSRFQSIEAEYKERLHNLFDKLPDFMEQIKEGVPSVEIRKNIIKEYGSLSNIFDEYESEAKGISGKFRSYTQNLGTIASDLQEGVMIVESSKKR